AIDRRRGTRPVRVVETTIISIPFVRPQNLTGTLVQTDNSLRNAATRCPRMVEQQHASPSNRGTGIAGANRYTPLNLQSIRRNAFDNPRFRPNPLAASAAP